MKVLIIVDHPRRDLPAWAWFASLATKQTNHNFYLVSKSKISLLFFIHHRPDIVIWNYARPSISLFLKLCKLLSIRNLIHDTEGIPYQFSYFYTGLTPATIKSIDTIMCWGSQQCDHIKSISATSNFPPKVIATGSVRCEYVKKSLDSNIVQSSGQNKILFNTNFPSIDPLYGSISNEYKVLQVEHGYSFPQFCSHLIENASLRQHLIDSIQLLLDLNFVDASQVILRPHPFEKSSSYQALSDQGVEISHSNLLEYDLKRSNFVIHLGCQTALDAYLVGIPSYVLKHYNYGNIWSKVSSAITFADLKKLCQIHIQPSQRVPVSAPSQSSMNIETLLCNIDRSLDLGLIYECISNAPRTPHLILINIAFSFGIDLLNYFSNLFLRVVRRLYRFTFVRKTKKNTYTCEKLTTADIYNYCLDNSYDVEYALGSNAVLFRK